MSLSNQHIFDDYDSFAGHVRLGPGKSIGYIIDVDIDWFPVLLRVVRWIKQYRGQALIHNFSEKSGCKGPHHVKLTSMGEQLIYIIKLVRKTTWVKFDKSFLRIHPMAEGFIVKFADLSTLGLLIGLKPASEIDSELADHFSYLAKELALLKRALSKESRSYEARVSKGMISIDGFVMDLVTKNSHLSVRRVEVGVTGNDSFLLDTRSAANAIQQYVRRKLYTQGCAGYIWKVIYIGDNKLSLHLFLFYSGIEENEERNAIEYLSEYWSTTITQGIGFSRLMPVEIERKNAPKYKRLMLSDNKAVSGFRKSLKLLMASDYMFYAYADGFHMFGHSSA